MRRFWNRGALQSTVPLPPQHPQHSFSLVRQCVGLMHGRQCCDQPEIAQAPRMLGLSARPNLAKPRGEEEFGQLAGTAFLIAALTCGNCQMRRLWLATGLPQRSWNDVVPGCTSGSLVRLIVAQSNATIGAPVAAFVLPPVACLSADQLCRLRLHPLHLAFQRKVARIYFRNSKSLRSDMTKSNRARPAVSPKNPASS